MTHLSDAQIVSYLAAEEDAATRAHLAACDACRRQTDRIRKLAGSAKSSCAAVTDRTPAFWARQRASAASHLAQRGPRVWRFASGLALIIAIAVLLFQFDRPAAPSLVAHGPASISDEALMAAVSSTLQQQVPDALEPAQLLVDQREIAESGKTIQSHLQGDRR